MTSIPEQDYQVRKTLQKQVGKRMVDIYYINYRDGRFIVCIDKEHMSSSSSLTRIPTKAGDLLTLELKPQRGSLTIENTITHNLLYTLHHDSIPYIMDRGVAVLE